MADDADEVKQFHSQDNDEIDPLSSDQLAEDKKEVVLEAELESRPQDIGVNPGAFSKPQPASPNFAAGLMGMGLPMAPFSPSYAALQPNPMALLMMNQMNMMMRSPGLMPGLMPPALYSPNFMHAAMMCGPGSPLSMAMAGVKVEPGVHLPANMRGGGGNPLSTLSQFQMNQMRFPGSPITSLANGMQDMRRTHGGGKIKKEDHVKKPLNAFMWFMKENRPKMMNNEGFKDKQSAELNKELGKLWRELPTDEQQKYFEMAKKDKEDHKAKFPNWSARENYAVHKKKKKRRDKSDDTVETKKCRARFGTHRQELWCKFCKRKKKCEWATVTDIGMGDMQDRISASGSSGPSPMASSSSMEGPSPLASHNDSDSESDIDADMDDIDDDEGDTTLLAQALQDVSKPEPAS